MFRNILPLIILTLISVTGQLKAQIVGFDNSNLQVTEDSLLLQIPISLSLPDNDSTRVTVVLGPGGSATASEDFNYSTQVLIWPPNDSSSRNVTLRVLEDFLVEYDEMLSLRIISATNGAQLVDSVFNLEILDDDSLRIGFNGAGQSVLEAGDTATFYVTLNGEPRQAVNFAVQLSGGNAILGTDFIWADGLFSFPANDSNRIALQVIAIEDMVNEGNEQVILDLIPADTNLLTGITAYTITIIDNDSLGTGFTDLSLAGSVYPNPATDYLIVDEPGIESIAIVALSGEVMAVINNSFGSAGLRIETADLPTGMYLLRAIREGEVLFGKFLKE